MSSKFSNKYPIPEKFPEILHDYAREVVRYMPKDILDFSIQYFYSLESNIKLNYIEGGSKDIPKLTYALEQKEKTKEIRDNLSTPSLATNQNTQNMFYKQTDISAKKEESRNIKEIKETNSSQGNTPIVTEESKHDSCQTNGSGVVKISKNFVATIFDNGLKRRTEGLDSNRERDDIDNKDNVKFNKSAATFSNISGTSSVKNGVRNFVGDVIDESRNYVIETAKK